MLQLEHISKKYFKDGRTIHALDSISLDISRGEFVAIQGPSGCGKTTLLLTAGALLRPDEGHVVLEGVEINKLKADEGAVFRANNIGFVFQQYHLIPYLNVLENIQLPMLALRTDVPQDRMSELVGSLGLDERLKHRPAELSAGEKQRTALARALLFEPKLLLADEITGNLDRVNAEIVLRCLTSYTGAGGTVLLVTHDQAASQFADRLLSMEQGALLDKVGCLL